MNKTIKNSSNYLWLMVALSAVLFCGCGCNTSKPVPDPLAGFRVYINHDPDQTITQDYQDYIQKLSPEERKFAGPIFYFEDGTGQHAIEIKIGINNKVWRHVLIYDKNDKRIKAIKYVSGDYHS